MAATLHDMADPRIPLPDFLVLDASVILRLHPHLTHRYQTVAQNFLTRAQRSARRNEVLLLLPYLALEECYFNICKFVLQDICGQGNYWHEYYKNNPHQLSQAYPQLAHLRQILRSFPMKILEPDDLVASSPAPVRLSTRMLEFVRDFQVLPKDAAILAEAERVGAHTVATLDADWSRADGFDVIMPI
ncbi:MAG: hypothetical protein ACOC9C_02470 [Chloroflexota bacterium]